MGAAPRILLISDLHLEEARPALTDAFLHFLGTEAQSASSLYILGDLFNVWLGDDDDRPLRATVVTALREASQRGLGIRLLHGNRDFLLGERFATDCGALLLESPCLLGHGGRRFVLTHGDELCTRDTDYQVFRRQVRDPAWQGRFLARPLEERRAFAEQARARSRTMNSNKAADIMDVSQEEVAALLLRLDCRSLIHGHTHRPGHHHFPLGNSQAERLVLGDWGDFGWYAELGSELQLHRFPIQAAGAEF